MGKCLNWVWAKLTSARFLVTMFFCSTLCYAVWKCFNLLSIAMQDEKMFSLIKDIVMFVLGAFTTQVTNVINDYFKRTDRVAKKEESEENSSK